jgi:hypothetical protein
MNGKSALDCLQLIPETVKAVSFREVKQLWALAASSGMADGY